MDERHFVWPGDTLSCEIAKLQRQRSDAASRLSDALERVSKLEAEIESIDSSLSALRAVKGGAK